MSTSPPLGNARQTLAVPRTQMKTTAAWQSRRAVHGGRGTGPRTPEALARRLVHGGSKPPGELALGGVILDVASDLTQVGQAERGVAADREIDPYFGQQAVARDRNAGDHERHHWRKLERKRSRPASRC